MMEALAQFFGGLGLFVLGVKSLSGSLAALAGPRIRAMMARGTRGPVQAAALGLGMGIATQSSNAVTFVIASMRQAGLVTPRRALPMLAWANVGTAGLVLVATFDLRLAAFWLLALVSLAGLFADRREGPWRPILAASFGLALMLLGLAQLKLGAEPLREAALTRDILAAAQGFWLPAFLLGGVVTLVTQSSSTVSILVIAFMAAGLLSTDQAVAAVYGASLGSGIAIWLMARQLEGSARQPALYQALLRGLGALLFLGLLLLERGFGLPLVVALAGQISPAPTTQLAIIFLVLQLGMALLAAPCNGAAERFLGRWAPPHASEALARPRYLYPLALEDAASALTLVEAEQRRLLERLPGVLEAVRPESGGAAADMAASAALEREIGAFIAALLRQELTPDVLREAVRLQARLGLAVALRETLGEFVATLCAAGQTPSAVSAMVEALHLLMEELHEMQGAEAAGWITEIASDRGEMMQRLRRQWAGAADERLFAVTGLFERAAWLARRLALLEAERV